ncbi:MULTISPECIES: DUF5658 family protein [Haloarcula]|uniref:DUF5658 family protein n=1 Tax=Haloarcula TaxID=2237 RepID=UPI0023E89A55|nr:DUF5658 family protein [Halomicroarcula sp. SHR3]
MGSDSPAMGGSGAGWLPGERPLSESHTVLWTVVILSSLFDVVTTMVGMDQGFSEGNAVARAFIETYGTPGIGLLKFSALVVVVVAWARFDEPRDTAVLVGFALVSLAVVALNAVTLASL